MKEEGISTKDNPNEFDKTDYEFLPFFYLLMISRTFKKDYIDYCEKLIYYFIFLSHFFS